MSESERWRRPKKSEYDAVTSVVRSQCLAQENEEKAKGSFKANHCDATVSRREAKRGPNRKRFIQGPYFQ